MLQLSLNNVGEPLCFQDHGRSFFGRDRRRRGRSRSFLSGSFRFTQGAEMFPNLVGNYFVQRTGMRLPLNPEYGKILQDEVALDLQFTRQNVDSYIAHSFFSIRSLAGFPSAHEQAEICGLTD
jgi:hypothetical protein